MKIKIKGSELKQLIKEEWEKKIKEVDLKKQLDEIQSQLDELQAEDENMDEVKFAGKKEDGEEYYEKGLPKAEFEKKGSALIEDDEIEIIKDDEEIDLGDLLKQVGDLITDKIEDAVEEIKEEDKIQDAEQQENETEKESEEDEKIEEIKKLQVKEGTKLFEEVKRMKELSLLY